MPKVSPEYRTERRTHLLDAARTCFLRDGFHQTSMHDIQTLAGVSAGGVYRYFASKDDMIVAIAEENLGQVVAVAKDLAARRGPSNLVSAVADILDFINEKHAENGFAAIALLVWAESLRNPVLAGRLAVALNQLRNDFVTVLDDDGVRQRLSGHVPIDVAASLAVTLLPGYILNLATLGPDSVRGYADALRRADTSG